MVVFNDFSTYYSYNLVKSFWKTAPEQNREKMMEKILHHQFNYTYSPEMENPTLTEVTHITNDEIIDLKEEGEATISEGTERLFKKGIIKGVGAVFVSLGTWLAAPDLFAGPYDEIVGVALIWIGRGILFAGETIDILEF